MMKKIFSKKIIIVLGVVALIISLAFIPRSIKNKKEEEKLAEEKAIAEAQQLESSIEQLTDATEKLQLATEEAHKKIHEAQAAEQRVEKAKQEKIANYWLLKLKIIII